MVFASRLAVALAMVGFLSGPLFADVIPSRRSAPSDAPQKVESRLVELGLSKDAAKSQSRDLTDSETAYFANHPDRIQIVGQEPFGGQTDLLWWEWVFGTLALVGAIAYGGWLLTK